MSDDAKPNESPRLHFRRAVRDAVIDARLSNDLEDKKARQLLDIVTGHDPDSAQSEEVFQQSLTRSFLVAGIILCLLGSAWIGLFLITQP